jgi:hypothetical protein
MRTLCLEERSKCTRKAVIGERIRSRSASSKVPRERARGAPETSPTLCLAYLPGKCLFYSFILSYFLLLNSHAQAAQGCFSFLATLSTWAMCSFTPLPLPRCPSPLPRPSPHRSSPMVPPAPQFSAKRFVFAISPISVDLLSLPFFLLDPSCSCIRFPSLRHSRSGIFPNFVGSSLLSNHSGLQL